MLSLLNYSHIFSFGLLMIYSLLTLFSFKIIYNGNSIFSKVVSLLNEKVDDMQTCFVYKKKKILFN